MEIVQELKDKIYELLSQYEIDLVVDLCHELEAATYDEIRCFLIEELQQTENPVVRNAIAIVLGDLKCNEAIPVLVSLINDASIHTGSLVSALEELECEDYIIELKNLIIQGNYEEKWNFLMLLESKLEKIPKSDKKSLLEFVNSNLDEFEEEFEYLKKIKALIGIKKERKWIKTILFIMGENLYFDAITQKLNVTPTKVRKKQEFPLDAIEAGIAKDSWMFGVSGSECKVISEQLDALQGIFESKIEIIKELREKWPFEIGVKVIIDAEANKLPILKLSCDNINFLSRLNAEIYFELY